jgi:hypothetical protein
MVRIEKASLAKALSVIKSKVRALFSTLRKPNS